MCNVTYERPFCFLTLQMVLIMILKQTIQVIDHIEIHKKKTITSTSVSQPKVSYTNLLLEFIVNI